MELIGSINTYLEIFRGFVTKASNMIAIAFDLDASNIYIIALVLISIWSSKYILEFFYTTLEGRKSHWIILTIVIFWILRFLGI